MGKPGTFFPNSHRLTDGPMLAEPPDPHRMRLRRFLMRAGVVAIVLAGLVAAHRPILVGFAYLFRVDDPAPSDAIVLLLGGMNHRAEKAAELYRQKLAPTILMGIAKRENK